jgi:hypothetical protein
MQATDAVAVPIQVDAPGETESSDNSGLGLCCISDGCLLCLGIAGLFAMFIYFAIAGGAHRAR